MARITVEDCLKNMGNRFELTQLATQRALQLLNGAAPLVMTNDDKPVVIALREIAACVITKDNISLVGVRSEEDAESMQL